MARGLALNGFYQRKGNYIFLISLKKDNPNYLLKKVIIK